MLPEIPAPAQDEDAQIGPIPISRVRGRILVVDDESSVVSVVRRILSDLHVRDGSSRIARMSAPSDTDDRTHL